MLSCSFCMNSLSVSPTTLVPIRLPSWTGVSGCLQLNAHANSYTHVLPWCLVGTEHWSSNWGRRTPSPPLHVNASWGVTR
jgi:hypothetical protein